MGFKSFMCPSGINDFPNVDAKAIAAALPFLKKAGVPFFVHAELVSDIPKPQVRSCTFPGLLLTGVQNEDSWERNKRGCASMMASNHWCTAQCVANPALCFRVQE
eukprot:scaffold89263_cov18-Tisochrysis_lutea.AAC.3